MIKSFAFLLAGALLLAACNNAGRSTPDVTQATQAHAISATPQPTSSPTLIPTDTPIPLPTFTPTIYLAPTATRFPTVPPTPSVIVPVSGTYRDWPRYIHTVYRFVFAVPPGWTVSQLGANFIQLSAPFTPDIKVTIGVRWADEDVRIQRTGVPEGDLVQAGMIPFWGDEISKSILVFGGKDKAVLYNNGTEFRVGGNRVFTLGLGDFGLDYAAVDLTNFIETADAMVGSITAPE